MISISLLTISTFVLTFFKGILMGYLLYTYLPINIKFYFYSLNFYKICLVFLILYIFLILPTIFFYNYFCFDNFNFAVSGFYNHSAVISVADVIIMIIYLAAGSKLAEHLPGISKKLIATTVGVLIGSVVIVAKNFAENFTNYIGKKYCMFMFINLNEIFNLTGNSATDLLHLIVIFDKLHTYFLTLILYNLFLYYIISKESIVKYYLTKFLGKSIAELLNYWLQKYKKTVVSVIIMLSILLIIDSYFLSHYLNFYEENFDQIVEFYNNYKNKNK